jgi:hypothetical protein
MGRGAQERAIWGPAACFGGLWRPIVDTNRSPLATADENFRILCLRIYNPSQASAVDTRALAAPLAPSDDPSFSGGLLGRLVALAGIDPQNLNKPAPLPMDDERDQPTCKRSMRGSHARATSGMRWRCTTPENPTGARDRLSGVIRNRLNRARRSIALHIIS